MRDGSRVVLALGALIASLQTPYAARADEGGVVVTTEIAGLRSAEGVVRACLTPHSKGFPSCDGEGVHNIVVSAAASVTLDFGPVRPGTYAIAVLHDENDNGKADRALGMIPKEGFGFSRDAPVRMGPPSFRQAAFTVAEEPVRLTIRMRYML